MPGDRNALNHLANLLAEFRCFGLFGPAEQTFDLVAGRLDDGLDLLGDFGGFGFDGAIDGFDLGFQAFLLRFKVIELGDQGGVVPGLGDRADDPGDLPLRPLQSRPEFRPLAVGRGHRFLAIREDLRVDSGQGRLVDPLAANSVADNLLQFGALDQLGLRACPFRADGAATIVLGVAHRERRAAFAAEDEPGKKVLRTMGAIERDALLVSGHLRADRGLPGLDPVPKGVVDDPKVLVFARLPFVPWIGPRDPFVGRGIADIGTAVPFEFADIGEFRSKPARDSDSIPATDSDMKPATIPI